MAMSSDFSTGDNVQLLHTDRVGEVVTIRNGQAIINFDYITLTLPVEKIKHISSCEVATKTTWPPTSTRPGINILEVNKFLNFQPELDLHGMSIDEALRVLDQWIDQGILAGHKYLRIIHGKGRGLLRQQVHTYLATNELITKIIENHNWPGGNGITCIEL